MVREIAITFYLCVFRLFFTFFKLFAQQKKTTFVTSFGDNVLHTVNELEKTVDDQIVILKTNQCRVDFDVKPKRIILLFEPYRLPSWVRSIYHLATSRVVFIDNYFGFLAVSTFKPNVICVQLWHATGAIKQFGLSDPSVKGRSTKAIERFRSVYNRFDYVVVNSEKMAHIFKKSFGLEDVKMLRTGIPRTDFYFKQAAMVDVYLQFKRTHPLTHQKKILLYAPTYRDESLHSTHMALHIDQLYRSLRYEYILLLRLHPTVRNTFVNRYPDFIIDVSDYPNIHPLLIVTDILITDYSSIPFEFSLLSKPMIFYAYDLDDYTKKTGFWDDYESLVPGPIVKDTKGLIEVIHKNSLNLAQIKTFASEWNEYADGNSSKRLIEKIYEHNHHKI